MRCYCRYPGHPRSHRLNRHPEFEDKVETKVVDAGARSLRMIFQSKLALKCDILQEKNMKFLLSLLNGENENVRERVASVISHSCDRTSGQKALSDVGVLERLVSLLKGSSSSNPRDSCLESIAAIVRNNTEVTAKFACINNGKAVNTLDDDPFAMSDLIAGNEELHKLKVSVNAIEKLCNFLSKGTIQAKRLEGILLAVAELCSKLESCRQQLTSLEVLDKIAAALKHDSVAVRIASCMCIKEHIPACQGGCGS